MDSENTRVNAAWKYLRRAFHEDLKREANYAGTDWWQTTAEEQTVFGLSMQSMPWVVTAYRYYEEILDLTDTCLLPGAVMAVLRQDLAERIGMEPGVLSPTDFQKFAKLLGISNRIAHAWYVKHEFWCVRQGIVKYRDEIDGHSFNW